METKPNRVARRNPGRKFSTERDQKKKNGLGSPEGGSIDGDSGGRREFERLSFENCKIGKDHLSLWGGGHELLSETRTHEGSM